jgi:hypothetical protein
MAIIGEFLREPDKYNEKIDLCRRPGLVDREPAGLLGAHTAENPEIKITKKSNVHPAAAANPAAAQAQNESAELDEKSKNQPPKRRPGRPTGGVRRHGESGIFYKKRQNEKGNRALTKHLADQDPDPHRVGKRGLPDTRHFPGRHYTGMAARCRAFG